MTATLAVAAFLVLLPTTPAHAFSYLEGGTHHLVTATNCEKFDSITFKGKTVYASYPNGYKPEKGDREYSCAGFVNKFYMAAWQVEVKCLVGYDPIASYGDFTETDNPVVGDVFEYNFDNSGHVGIVKSVHGDTVTVIEQNCSYMKNGKLYAVKGRTHSLSHGDPAVKFFHYSEYDKGHTHHGETEYVPAEGSQHIAQQICPCGKKLSENFEACDFSGFDKEGWLVCRDCKASYSPQNDNVIPSINDNAIASIPDGWYVIRPVQNADLALSLSGSSVRVTLEPEGAATHLLYLSRDTLCGRQGYRISATPAFRDIASPAVLGCEYSTNQKLRFFALDDYRDDQGSSKSYEQLWCLEQSADGFYQIRNQLWPEYLTVDGNVQAGASLILCDYEPTSQAQRFTITKASDTDLATLSVSTRFTDIKSNGWYVNDVQWVVGSGLMSGYSNSTAFGIGKTLTRAELAAILARHAGADTSGKTDATNLKDLTTGGKWYTGACNWAVKNGVISGYTNAAGKAVSFGPNDPVTREQAFAILARYAAKCGINTSTSSSILSDFTDGANVSAWAVPSTKWIVEQGIASGSNGKLNPSKDVKREEIAKMVHLTANLIADRAQ